MYLTFWHWGCLAFSFVRNFYNILIMFMTLVESVSSEEKPFLPPESAMESRSSWGNLFNLTEAFLRQFIGSFIYSEVSLVSESSGGPLIPEHTHIYLHFSPFFYTRLKLKCHSAETNFPHFDWVSFDWRTATWKYQKHQNWFHLLQSKSTALYQCQKKECNECLGTMHSDISRITDVKQIYLYSCLWFNVVRRKHALIIAEAHLTQGKSKIRQILIVFWL